MIRVGKPLAPNTYGVYVGNKIVEVVTAYSQAQATEWARSHFGESAYTMRNVQAVDITFN